MLRNKPDLILGFGVVILAIIAIIAWVPNDSATGVILKQRGRLSIGDAMAPMAALALAALAGLLIIFDKRGVKLASHLTAANLRFILVFTGVFLLAVVFMRWSGPLIVGLGRALGLTEAVYRDLRDTVPWKYAGFVIGGTSMVSILICAMVHRFTWRAVFVGLLTVFGLIAIFDLPFPDALLPVFGFLIGIMKGATVGGRRSCYLFNMSGTPDALMTTLDGHPMAKNGQPKRALRIAQLSSVTGDTFSDMVLFICAPFLAVVVEAYLDLPEKTALLILSISFVVAVIGASVGKGLLAVALGLVAAFVGTGQALTPRLTGGVEALADGFPLVSAILGVLILGEIFKGIEDLMSKGGETEKAETASDQGVTDGLPTGDIRRIAPHLGRGAIIGTRIGALPGVGSTLAATLSYTLGNKRFEKARKKAIRILAKVRPRASPRPRRRTRLFRVPTLSRSCRLAFPATRRPYSSSSRRTPSVASTPDLRCSSSPRPISTRNS